MNPYEGLQNLVDQVPTLVQPIIVALAGMVPYIEGEGSAALGVLAGINPVVAAVAGATGNILCVVLVVLFGSRVRAAIVTRRARTAEVGSRVAVPAGVPAEAGSAPISDSVDGSDGAALKKKAKGRERLLRWVVRFGVPGASLIGPLALPTQLTAATLVASGVQRNWVILWQVIAIVLWTTVITLAATGVLTVLTG